MSFKILYGFLPLIFILVSCVETNEELLDKAYKLTKEKKYDKAINIYTKVIERNNKLELAYYNRGFAYVAIRNYANALADFNEVINRHKFGDVIFEYNKDFPLADEETRAKVSYYDALYERAQVKFYMDSLRSSFQDFQILINRNYEKSNCFLWQGTIWINDGQNIKACDYCLKAKQSALEDQDRHDAESMISKYCLQTK